MVRNNSRSPSSLVYAPFDWRAAVWASLIAALAFALLHTCLEWALRGIPAWMPLRMTAAIVLGPDILSPSDMVNLKVVLVAIALHVVLSIIYGTLLALVLPASDKAWAALIGGFYGLALYYVNFYGFNAFSPWFADERDWLSIASHFAFGAILACAYTAISMGRFRRRAEPSTSEHP